jgi:iron complex outermembrane receptor protein
VFLQLIVNNIANKQPPLDATNTQYPYYDNGSYTGYGRAYWLEVGVNFGGSQK